MELRKPIRVRMAPSPTGFLHIGGARTALFNYLFAKHYGGTFILRIEDTDKERSQKKYETAIIEDLQWLGIEWDEGPLKKGNYGSYYQSERNEIYEKYQKLLLEKEKVYRCYCTPEELEHERRTLLKNHQTPRYMGKCRDLTKAVKIQLESERKNWVLRYRIDETEIIRFSDLIRGDIQIDPQILGDFVIAKSDGGPVYNFAAAVDDIEMKISQVIRGEEHISNTPRQILLIRSFGFEPPQYAHVSIILASDRTKLSKRHGATCLGDYREQGYLAQALFNYLALLGWNPGDDREIMDKNEIIQSFSIERIIKSPAIFDIQKLSWMNGMYIRKKPLADIISFVTNHLEKEGFEVKNKDQKWLEAVIDSVRGYLERFDQVGKHVEIFFDEKFSLDENVKEKLLKNRVQAMEVLKVLDEILSRTSYIDAVAFNHIQSELKKRITVPTHVIFQTQRLALTGRLSGPEMIVVVPLLGVASCRKRIQQSLSILQ